MNVPIEAWGPSISSTIIEAFSNEMLNEPYESFIPTGFWDIPLEVKTKYPTYKAECNLPDCSICQIPIKKGEVITRLPCDNQVSHAFHKDCIAEWLKNNSTCPNCRSEV